MIGDILLFKNTGLIDAAIRWETDSEYTHVATDIGDGLLFESYPGIGCRIRPYSNDEPGLFRFRVKDSNPSVYRLHLGWLLLQNGDKYDFRGIAGFALDLPWLHEAGEWYCSEIASVYQAMCGYQLCLDKEGKMKDPRLTSPGCLAIGPLIEEIND